MNLLMMDHSLYDRNLFCQIQKGDKQAFKSLFLKYYEPLCNYIYRTTNQLELSEELISDVFVNLWKRAENLEIQTSVKAYLYTCSKNALSAHFKSGKNIYLTGNEEVSIQIEDSSQSTQAKIEFTELQEEIRKAINFLPEKCRQIFILNRIEGLKYGEISELLGLSEKTVGHQISKGLHIIRTQLFSLRQELNR